MRIWDSESLLGRENAGIRFHIYDSDILFHCRFDFSLPGPVGGQFQDVRKPVFSQHVQKLKGGWFENI